MKIAYVGTRYHGFQLQSNADTVQGRLEDALKILFSKRIIVRGCSRTDAGVHAKEYICAFAAETEMTSDKLKMAICGNLPDDITVYECFPCANDFDPRKEVYKKTYTYTVWNERTRNPFLKGFSYHVPCELDIAKMTAAAEKIPGSHDFAGFCSGYETEINTVRNVESCKINKDGGILKIEITADGFLYNMVRIIAGTLIEIGLERAEVGTIEKVLKTKDRMHAGPTAPPEALCLEKLFLKGDYENKNKKE